MKGSDIAIAATITGLFPTGTNNSGGLLPANAKDIHYTILETGTNPEVVGLLHPFWLGNDSSSQWIWEKSNSSPIDVTRTFRTTFDLDDLFAPSASITGLWAADNIGVDILLNGISTGNHIPGGSGLGDFGAFQTLTPFSISNGFVSGINTLDFIVQDVGVVSGFRVAAISGNADIDYEPTFLGISPTDITISEGQSANIDLFGTDTNSEPLEFFFNNQSVGIDNRISGIRSTQIQLSPLNDERLRDEGVFTNIAYVQDGAGQISNTVTQTVTVLNADPQITQFSVPTTVDEGSIFSFSASAMDPGINDVISYSWDLNGDGDFGDYTLSSGDFSYPDEGSYRFGLEVSDGEGGDTEETLTIEVKNVEPNIIKLTGDLNVKANETFSFLAEAFDPGVNDTLTFDWDLDGDGEFDDFTGSEGQVILEDIFEKVFEEPEQIKIALRVSDGDGGVTEQSFSVTVTPNNSQPDPPVFSSSNITIDEGQNVDITISATDADPEPLSFFLNDQLIGTDPSTSGTRSISTNLGPFVDEGAFTNVAYVEDTSNQRSNTATQTITVLNVAPTITQLTNGLSVKPNQLFDFFADAFDPGKLDELAFDWDLTGNGLFDDFTGKEGQWLFPEPGLFDVALRVSDNDGGEAFGKFSVTTTHEPPVTTPEPNSVLGLLSVVTLGIFKLLKFSPTRGSTELNIIK
ncbi:PKD domain-containing protein [Leptolyngbya cf. ectocarpi LEGE 11479]|uniref:PKD domain-containing protein n=1 Tax=Leptolyngbya cf. ectocarpi LEGE 11479 TaxID=1828722 RepID=A0A929F5M6_LEPEC|nr:PKD domain-containing protein [Leptolyngbya ectocarpi]MBE9067685.1 PKD domain-containing protein [Leptolyngbya cf. ectocarpi LEGE 11479]